MNGKKQCVLKDDTLLTSPVSCVSAIQRQDKGKINATINLRSVPLLAQLSSDEINQVKRALSIRRYTRREVIQLKGASVDSLLFLLSGRLQAIDLTDEGRVIGLSLLSPGDFFGEIALINNIASTSTVAATSNALAAFLPGTLALHLFTHAPSVASQIQRHLAWKVQRDYKFRALLSITNTSKRIVSFLSLMKQRSSGQMESVENLPTHQNIANMINTSRETVTRTLLTLAQQGIIRKDAHRLIIVNPEALRKLLLNTQNTRSTTKNY